MAQDIKITFNLTKENYDKLQQYVKQTGLKQSDIVRLGLRDFFNKQIDERDTHFSKMLKIASLDEKNRPFTRKQGEKVIELLEKMVSNIEN